MLTIDEVLTMDSAFLGMADTALRELRNEPGRLFGGIHVLFVGGRLQQLPVAGCPVYRVPDPVRDAGKMKPSDAKKKKYLDRIRGHGAYCAVNYVVILDENMRHRNDPEWKEILNRWRVGHYLESDIETANTTCFHKNWSDELHAGGTNTYCPIIVTSNALRLEFNRECAVEFCRKRQQILHKFPALVTRAKGSALAPSQRRGLSSIRDDKTGDLPIRSRIAVGMPVQCLKNVSAVLKLANGTIGQVVAIQTCEEDTSRDIAENRFTLRIHSQPPDIVYVPLNDHSENIFGDLPGGVVPVRPWKGDGVKVLLRDRTFSLNVMPAPLVPVFSQTREKCQGLTVNKLILAPLRHTTRRSPQKSSSMWLLLG